MTKHEIYFSKFCKHSAKVLEDINKSGLNDKFIYISIDKRFVKNNITYILNSDGTSFPLPPMISRVPTLLLKPNHEILSGNQILEYIKPQIKNISDEKQLLQNEPNPFCLIVDNGNSFGVNSDNFSFLDTSTDDLSAKGEGGLRQMYNYSTLNQDDNIYTPSQTDKQSKLNTSLEELEEQRKNDIYKK